MWLVAARLKSTAIVGRGGGVGREWLTLTGVSPSWAKLRQTGPRSRSCDNICIWKLDMKSWIHYYGFQQQNIPGVQHSPPAVTKTDFSSLLETRGTGCKSPGPPMTGSFLSTHRQSLKSLSHPAGTEPPGHRSLLWAQEQSELVEIFGAGQRQAVSPTRQTLNHFPLGRK